MPTNNARLKIKIKSVLRGKHDSNSHIRKAEWVVLLLLPSLLHLLCAQETSCPKINISQVDNLMVLLETTENRNKPNTKTVDCRKDRAEMKEMRCKRIGKLVEMES